VSDLTPSAIKSDDTGLGITAAARAALAWNGEPGPAGAWPQLRVAVAHEARATGEALVARPPTEGRLRGGQIRLANGFAAVRSV
jgi:hypothetical protein